MTTTRETRPLVMLGILCVLGASCLVPTVLAQTVRFRARLSPMPLDVSMQSTIAGGGSVTATLEGNKLTLTGTYERLPSAATAVRLHRGYRGVKGPSFADLTMSGGVNGTISGSIELTPAQAADLKKSLFYVQLHTEKAPDGTLWGWLLPVEEKSK